VSGGRGQVQVASVVKGRFLGFLIRSVTCRDRYRVCSGFRHGPRARKRLVGFVGFDRFKVRFYFAFYPSVPMNL
jgi:hypothetical protein